MVGRLFVRKVVLDPALAHLLALDHVLDCLEYSLGCRLLILEQNCGLPHCFRTAHGFSIMIELAHLLIQDCWLVQGFFHGSGASSGSLYGSGSQSSLLKCSRMGSRVRLASEMRMS